MQDATHGTRLYPAYRSWYPLYEVIGPTLLAQLTPYLLMTASTTLDVEPSHMLSLDGVESSWCATRASSSSNGGENCASIKVV